MKTFFRLLPWLLLLGIIIGILAMFKLKQAPGKTIPHDIYREAVSSEAYARERDDAAIQRVIDLFEDFSHENLERNIANVYAETLFFRDGFREVHSLAELEPYFLHSTKPLRTCTFDFPGVTFSNGDLYLRWIMNVSLNRDPEGTVDTCVGMSHIRFNSEGKVVFQQDYWDPTDILYSRIPVAGWLIQKVHNRL